MELQSAGDLQVHVQGGEDLVLYHGPKKSAKLNSLIDWATTHRRNKVKFIFCDTSKVSLQVAEPNSLSLYHQATQTWSVYKAKMHSRHNFEHWLAQHARSWIRHMSRDTYRKIAIDGHPSAVLFSRNKAEQAQQARDWDFEQLAEHHKGALLFSYCDLQADSHCARLLALLQLTQDDLPSLTLVHCPEGEDQDLALKYLPSSVLPKPEAARSLLSSFNSGEAVPFIRTEAEASQDDQGVLRLAAADVSSRLKFNKRREHDAVVLFHEGKDSPSSSRVDRPHPDSQDI